MSRDEILLDLYDRLTSRKLWLCLLSILFAVWNFREGRMTAVEFQTFVTVTVTAFSLAEGAADAAAAWSSTPETTVETTVTTGADEVPPPPPPPPDMDPYRGLTEVRTTPAKRARPSRAKGAKP